MSDAIAFLCFDYLILIYRLSQTTQPSYSHEMSHSRLLFQLKPPCFNSKIQFNSFQLLDRTTKVFSEG